MQATSDTSRPLITGVILAGGQGRRMGTVDKGLVRLHDRPMAQWAIERLRPQVDTLLINANQNLDSYARFGHPVVSDVVTGFAGPLAGLHAALSQARTPLVVTVPCDSPLLPHDLVERLHHALQTTHARLAIARSEGRMHPVFCLCRRDLLPHLSAFLEQGARQFAHWANSLDAVPVDFDDQPDAFRNINTAEELQQLARSTTPPPE